MSEEKLHRTYERALKNHPWGSALYIPVDAKNMYPGCIGVFNKDGHWIKNHGFTPLAAQTEDLQIITTNYQWDVVHSERISNMKVKVKKKLSLLYAPSPPPYFAPICSVFVLIDGSTKIVPSSVEATFQIDSASESVAVLQCGPIIRTGIGNINLSIKDWGKENKSKILTLAKQAKSLGGFFVVTATYKTQWCRPRCWSTADLEHFANLRIATDDGTAVCEASIQMSTKTVDKGGHTLPAQKVRVMERICYLFVDVGV